MTYLPYVQTQDRLAPAEAQYIAGNMDISVLLGTWINTNRTARGIAQVVLSTDDDGQLMVRAFGADAPMLCDWGEVHADVVYAENLQSHAGMAFTARYDFDFLQAHLQGNLNLGLLVLASFNAFTDDSGRSDYFAREFFYHLTTLPHM
jgi:hypothetical protein